MTTHQNLLDAALVQCQGNYARLEPHPNPPRHRGGSRFLPFLARGEGAGGWGSLAYQNLADTGLAVGSRLLQRASQPVDQSVGHRTIGCAIGAGLNAMGRERERGGIGWR